MVLLTMFERTLFSCFGDQWSCVDREECSQRLITQNPLPFYSTISLPSCSQSTLKSFEIEVLENLRILKIFLESTNELFELTVDQNNYSYLCSLLSLEWKLRC